MEQMCKSIETANSSKLFGYHLILNVGGVSFDLLDNIVEIENILTAACHAHNMTILDVTRHKFEPQGVSLALLLSESHCSIHTWPEDGVACIDLFSCNTSIPLDDISTQIIEAFNAKNYKMTILNRIM